MNPQATAGRIVHYYTPDGDGPYAAIVNRQTGVEGFAILTVFHLTGPVISNTPHSQMPKPGYWSWMPSEAE